MIDRLPTWIWSGVWLLAFIAGWVNVVGLLGFEHQAITHLTGNTSLLAESLSRGDGRDILHFLTLLLAFVVGCALSGLVIRDSSLQLGRRYGVALMMAALLLAGAVPLMEQGNQWGMYTAACACGLMNAMVSTYSGAVVRTTHVSGMFTDLGIALGHALRGLPVHRRRLLLCVLVISGFLAGGIIGSLSFGWFGYRCLLLPAGLTALTALVYGVFLRGPQGGVGHA